MSKFVHFNKYTRSSNFLFNEQALRWKKERERPLFWGNFNEWIWSISTYLEFTIFSGSMFCPGQELLKLLN